MSKNKNKRRARRAFTDEFKSEVVAPCRVGDRSIGQVASDSDLTETAFAPGQAEVDAGRGAPDAITTTEQEEQPSSIHSRFEGAVRRPSGLWIGVTWTLLWIL